MSEEMQEPKSMDLLEMQAIVASQINDATTYIDSNIAMERKTATEYYRGDKFGDEEDGRSQAVSRDVHDTVNAIMPSLMRIFFGPEKVVEFVPQGPEDVDMAQQATDYVNYIFTRDNPGFQIMYEAFKDALVRKAGIIKWWWDESEEVRTAEYSGLDQEQLAMLLGELEAAEKADIVESEQEEDGTLSVTIKLTKKRDRVVIQSLPPEEFLIDRNARTIDDATFVAHRSMKTVSELVAMGYDEDEVKDQSEEGDELRYNLDRLSRNPYAQMFGVVPNLDPAAKLVLYIEAYQYIDTDGDGISELVKICTIGPVHKIVHWEPVESRNFAAFICDPEPHTFFGQSYADKTMDIQRIKSSLLRSALDSLSLSINPRTVVSEEIGGPNTLADAMNTEIGAIIRARDPSAVQSIVAPDVSPSAFEAMGYMDQVKESRTGMSRVSLGLDPQALQNTSATAAAGQFTQSQQHIELIARIFAETGMRRMFSGILRLVVENQRKERMIQLTNKWVPMDPRAWRVNMDVVANVALGGGTNQEKAQLLSLVMGKQEQIIMQLGLDNPMVGLEELHTSYSQFLQLGGFRNPDAYFKDPNDAKDQPPAPPKPDPKMVEVQNKAELEQAKAVHSGQLEEQKALASHDLDRMKIEGELQLKRETAMAELALKRELLMAELELKQQQMNMEYAMSHAQDQREQDRKDFTTSVSVSSDVQPGGEPG